MRKTAIFLALAVLLAAPAAAQTFGQTRPDPTQTPTPSVNPWSFDAARAQRNYELLLRGQITLAQLSLQEFAEVQALDNAVRNPPNPDRRSARQKCLDREIADVGGSPSRLALRTIDLKCSQE